jgi:hypothetical protein
LKVAISSPQIPFEDYATSEIPIREIIQIMVGDFQRILVYPKKGFQISQDVNSEVLQVFNILKSKGFTRYLINE